MIVVECGPVRSVSRRGVELWTAEPVGPELADVVVFAIEQAGQTPITTTLVALDEGWAAVEWVWDDGEIRTTIVTARPGPCFFEP